MRQLPVQPPAEASKGRVIAEFGGLASASALITSVAGVGAFVPAASDDTAWAEYGARIGYAVTQAVTFDVFVNGVSGDDDIDTRVHGGGGLRYRF